MTTKLTGSDTGEAYAAGQAGVRVRMRHEVLPDGPVGGPWEVLGPAVDTVSRLNYDQTFIVIGATTDGYAPIPAVCDNEHNARLIASAPDLLAACKDMRLLALSHAQRYPGDRDAAASYERLLAAIAKAGGRA